MMFSFILVNLQEWTACNSLVSWFSSWYKEGHILACGDSLYNMSLFFFFSFSCVCSFSKLSAETFPYDQLPVLFSWAHFGVEYGGILQWSYYSIVKANEGALVWIFSEFSRIPNVSNIFVFFLLSDCLQKCTCEKKFIKVTTVCNMMTFACSSWAAE